MNIFIAPSASISVETVDKRSFDVVGTNMSLKVTKVLFMDWLTDLSVAQVGLVAQHDKREVCWVLGLALDQELLPPALQRCETGLGRDVKYQHAAVGTSVQRGAQRLEPLRTCCVPDLTETHREEHGRSPVGSEDHVPTGGHRSYLQVD